MIRLFNVFIPPATFILLVFESVFVTGAFLAATLLLSDLDPLDYLLYDDGLFALLFVVVSFLLGMHFQDLYTQIRVKSRVLLVQQLCMTTGMAFLAQGLISYVDTDLRVPVRVMLLGSAIAVPGVFLWRLCFGSLAGHMIGHTRLVTIGRSPVLDELREWIGLHPEAGLLVEASFETADELGALREMVKKQQQPPRIVYAGWGRPHPRMAREIMELQLTGYEVETAAATYEKASGRVSLYSLHPQQLIYSSTFTVPLQRFFYQKVLNGLVAAICLIPVAPLLVLTALALRLFQRGPVFRGETVIGLNGRPFRLYRFQTSKGAVGRMVRKIHLDGLPQFLSILRGDMAIIGPCPARPEYFQAIERYIPFYRECCTVRPGVTGWAQIHRSRPPGIEGILDKLEFDLYYIKNRSLGLDTLILLHALKWMMLESETPEPVLVHGEMTAAPN